MIKANEMFIPYGRKYEWRNAALQKRADLVLYLNEVNTLTDNDSLISEDDDTSFDNSSFKPSKQSEDTTDTSMSHLFANTQPPGKSSRVIVNSSKCQPPAFLEGGKRKHNAECDTKDDIPVTQNKYFLDIQILFSRRRAIKW
jgi:hypothetical protein